jgi:hypothetical protein
MFWLIFGGSWFAIALIVSLALGRWFRWSSKGDER